MRSADAAITPVADPTLSIGLIEQPFLVISKVPTQFDEVNLKQVNPSQLQPIYHDEAIIDLIFLTQAQDTPDNSLFSFQIGDFLEDEEATSKTVAL